ncbi:hypothetical protein GCM10027446_04630 [Angustibacter peucedani]
MSEEVTVAGFVQIIEYDSSRPDEIREMSERFREEHTGPPGPEAPQRITVVADRDRPNHYMTIVEFGSYELAMQNSEDPQTGEFAAKMAELCDGPPTFHNLDVLMTEVPA